MVWLQIDTLLKLSLWTRSLPTKSKSRKSRNTIQKVIKIDLIPHSFISSSSSPPSIYEWHIIIIFNKIIIIIIVKKFLSENTLETGLHLILFILITFNVSFTWIKYYSPELQLNRETPVTPIKLVDILVIPEHIVTNTDLP